jgi:hypothetical protein
MRCHRPQPWTDNQCMLDTAPRLGDTASSRPRLVPVSGLAPLPDSATLAVLLLLLLLLPLALTGPGTCWALSAAAGEKGTTHAHVHTIKGLS